jgi:lipoprotein-anchoring transpeptidase ErfK/SrfK
MSPQSTPSRRTLFLRLLLVLFFFTVMGLVMLAVIMGASPAMASILGERRAASSPVPPYSLADIPKPTYTPIPTSTSRPTATSMPTPTEVPGVVEMSIVEATSPPPAVENPAPAYSGGKYILVDISEQHMYVYENDQLIYSFTASTGMNNATRTGLFQVQSKIPNAYGSTWDIWMPDWLGIYYSGGLENGIHALPILPSGAELWSGFLGRPISYGCVVLGSYDADLLFNWAEIGTPVEIQW